MATTTQILFNSPALHSLKRDQLVKLCKIHSIKANGKNVELIERLKEHAHALPPEALASSETDDAMDMDLSSGNVRIYSEEQHYEDEGAEEDEHDLPGGFPEDDVDMDANLEGDDHGYGIGDVVLSSRFAIPRPSEQWEVVMDDIEEVDEGSGMGTMSSKGSLRTVSHGEFGTHSSKASVTSSLKALATSLGIKRAVSKSSYSQDTDGRSANSRERDPASFSPGKFFSGRARDSLAEHATPYAQLPPSDSLPDTDHFKFSTPDASILGGDEEDGQNAPVPGTSTRAGRPAPPGARLSLGVGQSTIRLVTHPSTTRIGDAYLMSPPRLAPIQPDFDIKMGTPSAGRILSVWPASPRTAGADAGENEERLYPKLPLENIRAACNDAGDSEEDGAPMPGGLFASASTPVKTPARNRTTTATTTSTLTPRPTNTPGPVDEPDMFSPAKPRTAVSSGASTAAVAVSSNGQERPHIPRSAPFLFGSPLSRRETPKAGTGSNDSNAGVSNIAFEGAAKSVLEEMQRRLAAAQKEKELNGEAKPARSTPPPFGGDSVFGGLFFGAGGSTNNAVADRYAKLHEAEFAKMDSIANHYAARRPAGAATGRKRKSEAMGGGARAGQKRRSSAAGTRVISNARVNCAAFAAFAGGEEDARAGCSQA
ncbi:hypothetical protein BC628DRAFT_163841 [Trametes gibbosa]|nr:hypothetical protein BC628DRAFT_163841 [Trametes gibbosa]